MRDANVFVLLVLASLVVWVLPPAPSRAAEPEAPEPALREITFERTRCYGACPAYKVTLRPDGTVTYVGEAHVERLGRHDGRVGRRTFERLSALMEAAGFFGMDDQYTTHVTDHASVITTATRVGGERKRVLNYADTGPLELWGIEMAIDGVLSSASWTKPDKSEKPVKPAR